MKGFLITFLIIMALVGLTFRAGYLRGQATGYHEGYNKAAHNKPTDINGDGKVDGLDLSLLQADWTK